jgi:hypothetical protein
MTLAQRTHWDGCFTDPKHWVCAQARIVGLEKTLSGLIKAAEREFDTRRCKESSLRALNIARAAIREGQGAE